MAAPPGYIAVAPGGTYAQPSDVTTIGLPPKALVGCPPNTINEALANATAEINAALNQYTQPIQYIDGSVVQTCVDLARALILEWRGWDPAQRSDDEIMKARDRRMDFLALVANGRRWPGIIDSAPGGLSAAPNVTTQPAQGWNCLL